MINDIEELRKKPFSYIKEFLSDCIIKEKIDGYYVSVDIISHNSLVFRKANGDVIEREDIILNVMWKWFINDWTHIKLVNKEWFDSHIGYTLKMFYLPSEKPILTKYKKGTTYIIDRIEHNEYVTDNHNVMMNELNGLNMTDEFKIAVMRSIKPSVDIDLFIDEFKAITKRNSKSEKKIADLFVNMIPMKKEFLFAEDEPEGYIVKSSKHIFQIKTKDEQRKVTAEKSQFEYVLMDFIKFWNSRDIDDCIGNDYVTTVCDLFSSYINDWEKVNRNIENNIDENSLESPCLGQRFDMSYSSIPRMNAMTLCKENRLYGNIFKILLVNLKRKKNLKYSVLMNQDKVDKWNEIVQTLKNIC